MEPQNCRLPMAACLGQGQTPGLPSCLGPPMVWLLDRRRYASLCCRIKSTHAAEKKARESRTKKALVVLQQWLAISTEPDIVPWDRRRPDRVLYGGVAAQPRPHAASEDYWRPAPQRSAQTGAAPGEAGKLWQAGLPVGLRTGLTRVASIVAWHQSGSRARLASPGQIPALDLALASHLDVTPLSLPCWRPAPPRASPAESSAEEARCRRGLARGRGHRPPNPLQRASNAAVRFRASSRAAERVGAEVHVELFVFHRFPPRGSRLSALGPPLGDHVRRQAASGRVQQGHTEPLRSARRDGSQPGIIGKQSGWHWAARALAARLHHGSGLGVG